MRSYKLLAILIFLFLFDISIFSQSGSIDSTFSPTCSSFGSGGVTINSSALQSDGKIIVGGSFVEIGGFGRINLARLNQDGTTDLTFNTGSGVNGTVFTINQLANGKILIGGSFTKVNGANTGNIARLNPDGTLDNTFNTGTGFNNTVISIFVQNDEKILVGGSFTSFNSMLRNRLVRLNSDGSIDLTFDSGSGPNIGVATIIAQRDGKILIGGSFAFYNGVSKVGIAQLNSNGSLNSNFNVDLNGGSVRSIKIQSDNKILIGGIFGTVNGFNSPGIARIDPNGVFDEAFNVGDGANGVFSISIQNDGKIIVGGSFFLASGVRRNGVARFLSNGSLDGSFVPGTELSNFIDTTLIISNSLVFIGGVFTSVNSISRNNIALLGINGSLISSFNPGSGESGEVHSLAIQPNQKIILGGQFSKINGVQRSGITRVNQDGTLDLSFFVGNGISGSTSSAVFGTAVQNDGKILIAGDFSSFNSVNRNRLVRLNEDGSVDLSFNIGTGADGVIRSIVIQPNNKIIISGDFLNFNGIGRTRIARLNEDGSVDLTFNPVSGANGTIRTVFVQPDGKILIGGDFSTVNGANRMRLARLNPDGTIDFSFNISSGANNTVNQILVQPNDRILVCGAFTNFNNNPVNRIVRLNSDGTLDQAFNTGTGSDSQIFSMSLRNDGSVFVAGQFSSINSISRSKIALLNPNGSLNLDFDTGSGANQKINFVTSQADGRILTCGLFSTFSGFTRVGVARLLDSCPSSINSSSFNFSNQGGSGNLSLTISLGCPFTVIGVPEWISGFPSNGVGPQTFTFSVDPNSGPLRTASIFISGQQLLVTQSDGCSFSLSQSSAAFSSAGGSGNVILNATNPACTWTTSGVPSWISGIPASGAGTQVINFIVAQSAGELRTANITIAGQSFTVTQAPCGFSLSQSGASFSGASGAGSVILTTSNPTCAWTTSGVPNWISGIPASGVGSATINFLVARNTSLQNRSANIFIAGQSYLVTQSACATPEAGRYPAVVTAQAGGTVIIDALVRPFSEGTLTLVAPTVDGGPVAFAGGRFVNANGTITLTSVGPVGTYVVSQNLTDDCNNAIGVPIFTFNVVGTGGIISPTVSLVSPLTSAIGGNLTLTGTNFVPAATSVLFGGIPGIIQSVSPTQVVVTVPPGALGGPLTVLTSRGSTVTSQSFSVSGFVNPPTVASLDKATAAVGDTVTVSGTNFVNGQTQIRLSEGQVVNPTVLSATQATFVVPSGAISGPVTVLTPAGSAKSGQILASLQSTGTSCPRPRSNVTVGIGTLSVAAGQVAEIPISFSQICPGQGANSLQLDIALNPAVIDMNGTFGVVAGDLISAFPGGSLTVARRPDDPQSIRVKLENSNSAIQVNGPNGNGTFCLLRLPTLPTAVNVPNGTAGVQIRNDISSQSFFFRIGEGQIAFRPRGDVTGNILISTGQQCGFLVSPTTIPVGAPGQASTVSVNAPAGCGWTAVSNAPWITVTTGASGNGNGTVGIVVGSNPGAARTGTLTVAGQTVTVTQPARSGATPGQYRPSNGFVYLRDTNDTGIANVEFFYGVASDIPIAGDWNGDGVDTVGIYRIGQFFLRNSNSTGEADINFAFGAPGDLPIAGDWDGDGIDTIGLVRGNLVFLRNSNSGGVPDTVLVYGNGTDIYIAGDWNGDGIDTIGCFRPTNGFVYLRNENTSGVANLEFFYGIAGDRPVAGDWNGDGIDTVGVVRGNTWLLRNTNDTGVANLGFTYGTDTDVPIVGDWNGIQ